MQDQIKNLPKKYFQITDENKRDRMVAYVRLDEVMEIVSDTYTYNHTEKIELCFIPGKENQCYISNGILICHCGKCTQEDYPLPKDFTYAQSIPSIHDKPLKDLDGLTFNEYEDMRSKKLLTYSEVTYNEIVPGIARLSEESLEKAHEIERNQYPEMGKEL